MSYTTPPPEEQAAWDALQASVRDQLYPKLKASDMVMTLVPSSGVPDVKMLLEMGMAVMLDKPIMAVVLPGGTISKTLARLAEVVVEGSPSTEEGQARISAGFDRMLATLDEADGSI